jgi:hypothetical protein
MEIKRIGSQPSNRGPADWFTGTVRIDPLFQANAGQRLNAASLFSIRRRHMAHTSTRRSWAKRWSHSGPRW